MKRRRDESDQLRRAIQRTNQGRRSSGDDDDATLHQDSDRVSRYYKDVAVRLLHDDFQTTKNDRPYTEWQQMINFVTDREKYGDDPNDCRDLRLKTPFTCLIAGKSQSGKTELLLSILSQWRYITTDHEGVYCRKLYWYYGTASPDQMNRVKQIFEDYRMEDGATKNIELRFVHVTSFKDEDVKQSLKNMSNAIVVFDDLMNQMSVDEYTANLFTRESHHNRLCVFHLWQNIFPTTKFAPEITRNTQYKILFMNPETSRQLRDMLSNMYPYEGAKVFHKIMDFFKTESPENYPFVMFRTSPQEKNRDCTIVGYAVNRNIEDVKNHIFLTPPHVIQTT